MVDKDERGKTRDEGRGTRDEGRSETAARILPTTIEQEMKSSYIDYAMSVIVGRALPDVRDGLKPVHRRILYAMDELGLQPGKPYKKSARIVGECFVKDTLVLTEKGLVPIQEVECGEVVYTQTGKRRVTALYEMPEQELLKVTLENGISNTVTPSQKFKVLTKDLQFEWKEARELSLQDYIVIKASYPEITDEVKLRKSNDGVAPKFLNENLAYLLGFWISDGWIEERKRKKGSYRLCFFSTSRSVIERVSHILQEEFGYQATIEKKTKEGFKDGFCIRINCNTVNNFLVSNFSLQGRRAETKEIPTQIFCSPPRVIFSFISGLIDGDGSIHKSRAVIHYGSVSERLIEGLQVLLQHLGVLTVRYEEEAEKGREIVGHLTSGKQKFYFIEASGVHAVRLGKNLKLAGEEKTKKLADLLLRQTKQVKYDIVPFLAEAVFRELSNKHRGGGWYQAVDGESFRMGIKYPGGSKIRYSYDLWSKPLRRTQIIGWGIKEKLKKMGSPLSELLEEIISNDLYFLPVAFIQRVPAQKTYDIEVAGDHEFVANGMLSHNCLGKYHPHGDMAVYDAMVRMAQDFSLRYPLVDGQGNMGSIDGDPPAAMRYTEARLSPFAVEMLSDIEKETVNFGPNFDESLQEPLVLPSKIPNLLINGSSGIAVGMATNIPPHNLSEIVDGLVMLIDEPETSIEELMKVVRGPDFPTGGLICGKQGIKDSYTTGRGQLTLRARFEVERAKAGKEAIIVTEIPYMTNKAELIEEIAELVKAKKITGISDLRDESDREGMRIYIELKREATREVVLNQLFKHTALQTTFGVNLVALVDGEPKLLTLKEMMVQYLKHREEVVTRRTQYELRKAEEQAHILEGLVICVSNIDAVVNLIKKSKNVDEAREGLMKKFDLTKIQAQAILDLKLQRLTALERLKIEEELKALKKLIGELKEILASRKKLLGIVKKELLAVKEKYGDKRRTEITAPAEEIEIEQLIPEMEVAVLITRDGYVKRVPVSAFKAQLRGGRGVAGMTTREEDEIENIFTASTHAFVLFFTNLGRVYKLKVYDLPEASRAGKGQAIANVLQVGQGEIVTAAVPVENFEKKTFLMMATRNGMIKKVPLSDFANVRRSGIIAVKLKEGDELGWVRETDGRQEVILGAESGLMIRFSEKTVRPMGRAASGVRGMRLEKGDKVVSMDVIREGGDLLVISRGGFGKRMKLDEFAPQNRGGKGHIAIKLREKDKVAKMTIIHPDDELLFVTAKGTMSRQKASGISTQGRYAKGVRIQRVDEGDYIVDLARVVKKEEAAEVLERGVEKEEERREELLEKIKEERAKLPIRRRKKK